MKILINTFDDLMNFVFKVLQKRFAFDIWCFPEQKPHLLLEISNPPNFLITTVENEHNFDKTNH